MIDFSNYLESTPTEPPETQLRNEIAKHCGGHAPETILFDGAIHRFSTDDSKIADDAGWYIAYGGEVPAGVFGDWRAQTKELWHCDMGTELTPDDLYRIRQEQQEAMKEMQEARERVASASAETAENVWQNSEPASDDHAYLSRKKVKAHGIRQKDKKLVIPLYNAEGKMSSLQFIAEDGTKRFLSGGASKGCWFLIGDMEENASKAYLCEGYATGASVYEASGVPVFIAFSAGNLASVATMIKEHQPSLALTIVADNDESGTGEKAAEFAASKSGARVRLIPEAGMDANDYAASGRDLKAFLEEKHSWFVNANTFLTQPEPPKWWIKNWIPEHAFCMIHGASGSGKTFVLLDWLLTISSGLGSWMGETTKNCDVCYLCGEGNYGLRARVAAWAQEHHTTDIGHFVVSESATDFDKETGIMKVEQELSDIGFKPGIVAIDTLNRFFSGDENSAQDARAFNANVGRIMNDYGCTVIVVHHTGLADDAQQRARGSSAWQAALDVEISVRKEESGVMTLQQKKMKDFEPAPPKSVELQSVEISGWKEEDGTPVTSAIVVEAGVEEVTDTPAMREMKAMIESAIVARGTVEGQGLCYVTEDSLKGFLRDSGWGAAKVKNAFRREPYRPIQQLADAGWLAWDSGRVTVTSMVDRMRIAAMAKAGSQSVPFKPEKKPEDYVNELRGAIR